MEVVGVWGEEWLVRCRHCCWWCHQSGHWWLGRVTRCSLQKQALLGSHWLLSLILDLVLHSTGDVLCLDLGKVTHFLMAFCCCSLALIWKKQNTGLVPSNNDHFHLWISLFLMPGFQVPRTVETLALRLKNLKMYSGLDSF